MGTGHRLPVKAEYQTGFRAVGPNLPFAFVSVRCGAARRTGHSLRPQNQMMGELTQCGTSRHSMRLLQWQPFISASVLRIEIKECRMPISGKGFGLGRIQRRKRFFVR